MTFDRGPLQRACAALASQGVFLGTSSWKYAGWRGQIYDEARYLWHGRFAEKRFEQNCLAEYAEVFPTVCVDGAYYRFPEPRFLAGLLDQVPASFLFAFKVTDEITLKRFPNLPRCGARAGQMNPGFLDAARMTTAFLEPCQPCRAQVGLLIFEFSRFYPIDFARGREFVAALDQFLGQLPKGWPYGVEMRNPNFLQPEYFATLARHEVAHIYNSWSGMPSVLEQMALPGSIPHPGLCGARFLLRPGRKYQEAVDRFQPYDRLQDPYPEARQAGAKLIVEGKKAGPKQRTFRYVNNRLEGNAILTVSAMLEAAAGLTEGG